MICLCKKCHQRSHNIVEFIISPSWKNIIQGAREKLGDDFAEELAEEILGCGLGLKIETKDPLIIGIINGAIKPMLNHEYEIYHLTTKTDEAENGDDEI